MSRFVVAGGLVFALLLLGLGLRDGRLVALALPLAVYILAALYYGPYDVRLRASRSFSPDPAFGRQAGDVVDVTVEVHNEGGELEEVWVEDRLPAGLELVAGQPAALAALPGGGQLVLRYQVRVTRRGLAFGPIEAVAGDRLGLFCRRVTFAAPGQILVLPRAARLRHVTIRPRRTRDYAGPVPARLGGSGVDFYGVREYQAGDPRRWINWRASARHPHTVFTNEFEQERIADVGLILDARQRSDVQAGGDSLFEHGVAATAALAGAFLQAGNRVGLLVYGRAADWTFPGYGKVQRERILHSLARARTGDSQVFDRLDYLPTRLFPAQSQIVLVSPLCRDDLPMLLRLRARGYQVLVVRPDPVALEARALGEQPAVALAARLLQAEWTLLHRRLLRAGITVVDWQVDESLDQAIHRSWGRAARWGPPATYPPSESRVGSSSGGRP